MKKISELTGMDVYSDNAKFIGKVFDVIMDLQKGEVVRLALEPIRASSREEVKRIFQEKTVLYRNVRAAERIIIVSSTSLPEEPEPEPEKPAPLSYRQKYLKR